VPIISQKARCAFHGLACLARRSNGSPVPFDEILAHIRRHSAGPALSPGYIAKILQNVARAGIVESVPGPSGGYRLARRPSEIPLREVVEVLDGPLVTRSSERLRDRHADPRTSGVETFIFECERNLHESLQRSTVASLAPRAPAGF
jgi:Rrf2 family protein